MNSRRRDMGSTMFWRMFGSFFLGGANTRLMDSRSPRTLVSCYGWAPSVYRWRGESGIESNIEEFCKTKEDYFTLSEFIRIFHVLIHQEPSRVSFWLFRPFIPLKFSPETFL